MSRTTSSTIVPAVPVVPVTPAKLETPAKTKKGKQPVKAPEAVDVTPVPSRSAVPSTPTKPPKGTGAKAQDTTEPLSKTPVDAVTKKTEPKEKKPTPETPAKTAAKGKAANKKVEKVEKAVEESSQKVPAAVTTAAAAATTTDKRQHLGKLDITAAKAAEKELVPIAMQGKTESPTKSARTIPFTTTSSVPASPAVVAAPSPIKHAAAPRTLRLVSTPKVETPPAVAAPPPPLPQIPTVDKLRSRQASIASLNQPGTPASELISDTASMTSGMISRASSPPPTSTIVGSAPVRKVTKAQAKKNRQERKRQEEEKEKVEAGSDVEVVQAPIIGRKKKAKKPNTTPKPVAAMASAMKEAAAKSQPASPKSATVEDEPLETPSVASVKVQSARNSVSVTPEPEIQPEEVKERNEPSAQSVLNDLQKTGDLLVSALEFFKPLSSTHASRTSSSGHATMPPDLKIHFSEADLDALAKKMPVHINGQDGKPDSRTLITPNGTFLWGLTAELEERALHLESEIEKLTGYLRFHPTSKSASNHNSSVDVLPALATAIREAAVPKKLPNSPTSNLKFDPQTLSQQLPPVHPKEFTNAHSMVPTQQQTPADAGAYLNQFVLPATDNPPPNHPRPEMAAVGGAPGSGTTHISIQPGPGRHAEGFEKVARAVLEGGAVGSTEIDGLASMTGDKSGGVWVRGLEGLIGAGLGMGENPRDRAEIRKVLEGLDQAGFALPPSSRELPLSAGSAGGRFIDRRCVLGLEEAEHAMALARREHEVLERKLGALIKRNRKLATGNAR